MTTPVTLDWDSSSFFSFLGRFGVLVVTAAAGLAPFRPK
jgi:hypothetical protein